MFEFHAKGFEVSESFSATCRRRVQGVPAIAAVFPGAATASLTAAARSPRITRHPWELNNGNLN